MPPTPLRFLLALEQGSVKGHDDANGERVAPSTSYVCDPRGSAMYAIKDRDRAGDRASDRHEGAGDRSFTVGKLPNVIAFLARVGQQYLGVVREGTRGVGGPAHHAQSG